MPYDNRAKVEVLLAGCQGMPRIVDKSPEVRRDQEGFFPTDS